MTKKWPAWGPWVLAFALIFLAIGFRFVDHPANFTPILAVALFAGAIFPKPWMAMAVVLITMLISDSVVGFHPLVPIVYLSLGALVLWGSALGPKKRGPLHVGLGLGGGALLFFLTTNLAVWWTSGMYPKSGSGLVECYLMGLPFFRNTLVSTGLFGGMLFSVWNLAGQHLFLWGKTAPARPR